MRYLYWLSLILTIIGGINWGLIGYSNYNLVANTVQNPSTENTIYMLVGFAALYLAFHSVYNTCIKSKQ